LPPEAAQRMPRCFIVRVKGQDLSQMGHGLLWIFHECRPFQPRLLMRRIDLQYCSKVTPRAIALPSVDSISRSLHKCLNLLLRSNRYLMIGRQ
jgi:hypothetical protein